MPAGLPPGPRNPLVQSLRYMRDPFGYYAWARRRYGDLYTMPTMNGTIVMTCSAAGAREVLAGREEDFEVGFGVDTIAPILGSGSLLLMSGVRHQRERKLLSPTFHGKRMRAYRPTVAAVTRAEIAAWQPGQRFSGIERMQAIGLDVIIRTVFGAQSEARVAEFRQLLTAATGSLPVVPLFLKFMQRELGGIGPWAGFLRRMRRLEAAIQRRIDEERGADGEGEDVLAKLLRARHEDGSGLGDREIRDELLTLLVAGHETTATTLAWTLYEIHRNPEVLARARDEIAALGAEPDPDALAELPYLDAVCHETLRLHPILPEFFRTVKDRYTLQGYEVPAGYHLAAAILAIHQDPAIYPEPERFRPERFLERRFSPWEFVAFGGGHRRCIGAAFALNEMKVVLGTLLPAVELAITAERPLRTVRRNITLAPEGGVPLEVRRTLAAGPARAA